MANPSPDLLPCPFCGGAARIESNRDWHKLIADCDDDCVLADGEPVAVCPAYDEYRARLVDEWNRRAATPSPSTAPEVDDNARDAARYRWMRDHAQWFKAGLAKTEAGASSFHYGGELLDQLVDAGRAASTHGDKQ